MLDRDFIRQQLITFSTPAEVCAMLKIDVESLLRVYEEEFLELMHEESLAAEDDDAYDEW